MDENYIVIATRDFDNTIKDLNLDSASIKYSAENGNLNIYSIDEKDYNTLYSNINNLNNEWFYCANLKNIDIQGIDNIIKVRYTMNGELMDGYFDMLSACNYVNLCYQSFNYEDLKDNLDDYWPPMGVYDLEEDKFCKYYNEHLNDLKHSTSFFEYTNKALLSHELNDFCDMLLKTAKLNNKTPWDFMKATSNGKG